MFYTFENKHNKNIRLCISLFQNEIYDIQKMLSRKVPRHFREHFYQYRTKENLLSVAWRYGDHTAIQNVNNYDIDLQCFHRC